MPPLARHLLARADLIACAKARYANYRLIDECLREVSAIEQPLPTTNAGTCPWGYPIVLPDRAAVDYQLSDLGVPFNTFAEQLHPTLRSVASDSLLANALSRGLLFLATHQSLSTVQIERFCAAIVKFFAGTPRR